MKEIDIEKRIASFPYEMAAFDLDGTLMRFDSVISDRTLQALERLRGAGIKVVLATGRKYETAREHGMRLGFSGDDPIVCYGGSVIRTVSGETLLYNPIDRDGAVEVLRWAEGRRIRSRLLLEGKIVASHPPIMDIEEEMHVVESPSDWLAANGEEPIEVTLVDEPGRVEEWLPEAEEAFSDRFFVTRSLPHYVEIGSPEGTKSSALAKLCGWWDVDPENLLAFGDGENDIDMLRFAGHGVAVGPMSGAVREAADAVTESADEDGVARYLERLFERAKV